MPDDYDPERLEDTLQSIEEISAAMNTNEAPPTGEMVDALNQIVGLVSVTNVDVAPDHIETGVRYDVGPYTDLYGHPAATLVGSAGAVCLTCGYVAADTVELAHTECDPEQNEINESWGELVEHEHKSFPTPEVE